MAETADPSRSATDDQDLSGRQLGDYRLLRRLGRGGMADVYLAEQESLKRQVAVKVLRRSLSGDANYVRRFQVEAQAAAALVHSNIVQIYEVGCVDGCHYIAQEYVQGLNLGDLLARRGPPELKQAVAIMRQTAAALVKASERGIVHRDIKPENILLSLDGVVKVADFGLARINGELGQTNLTQTGFTMGTPLYMSPEQVEGKPVDSRTDLYSFGCTCYHMLSGEAPFRGDTALAVALAHLKQQPLRLEALRPDLPPALGRIVHKLLSKRIDDRYTTAREVLRDLRLVSVPGLEDDDTAELEGVSETLPELEAIASHREMTRQLDGLMKTVAMEARSGLWWRGVALAALLALLGGGALAWATRPQPLLPPDAASKASAAEQYQYATRVDDEKEWRKVIDYFPADTRVTPQARLRLGEIYLAKKQFDLALAEYQALAAMDEPFWKARGLLAQALLFDSRLDLKRLLSTLEELAEYRDLLFDAADRDKLVEVVTRHQPNLSESQRDDWRSWSFSSQQFGPGPPR